MSRLLRDRTARRRLGGRAGSQPERRYSLRRTGQRLRRGRAAGPRLGVRRRLAIAGHLLRDAGDGASARRRRRADRRQRVRAGHAPPEQLRQSPLRWASRFFPGVDEPRRPHHGYSAWIRAAGPFRQLSHSGAGQRQRRVWNPVPRRGRAHAAGQGAAGELPVQGVRLRGRVVRGQFRGALGERDPRDRWRGQGDMRAVRRRRFRGHRRPRASRHWRPAHSACSSTTG